MSLPTRFFFDSLDKIVRTYFVGVTADPFTFDGEQFFPKKISVSPLIFRGTTCPQGCGACCQKFHLFWLPGDARPESPTVVTVDREFNGLRYRLFADVQSENSGYYCHNLDQKTGLCGIHTARPFSCDFELIRFTHRQHEVHIATRLFGRGWAYTRITGQERAICDVLPPSEKLRDDAVRKLTRLKEWTDYFGLRTHLPQIINWVASGPHNDSLVIRPGVRPLFFEEVPNAMGT